MKTFVTNQDMYLNARKRKFEAEGRIECTKHKDQYYNPKKFTGCYQCYLENKK